MNTSIAIRIDSAKMDLKKSCKMVRTVEQHCTIMFQRLQVQDMRVFIQEQLLQIMALLEMSGTIETLQEF